MRPSRLHTLLAPMLLAAAQLLGLAAPSGGLAAQQSPLVGAWAPEAYVLADGPTHPVSGRIFFTDVDWAVIFFVTEDGQARRGSAEGGTYAASGQDLTFTHLWHISAGSAVEGLPESPLRMNLVTAEDAATEPSRFQISGDRLTVFFPSGNRMEFRRASEF